MSAMIQWCETPRPKVKRPPHTAWFDSACWASTMGWRGCSGTMAVPTSIRVVAVPMSVAAVMTSNSSGICGVQTESRPGLVGPAGVGLELLDLGGVPASVGAHLQTHAHRGPFRPEIDILRNSTSCYRQLLGALDRILHCQ